MLIKRALLRASPPPPAPSDSIFPMTPARIYDDTLSFVPLAPTGGLPDASYHLYFNEMKNDIFFTVALIKEGVIMKINI